jgi:hypothetical protein
MRLLDKVAQATAPLVVNTCAHTWRLPGAGILADGVRQCPLRYVLNDEVTEICARLALEADTVLGSSIALLRIPAPRLWLEFGGIARKRALTDPVSSGGNSAACPKQRAGLLVTCDERGRKGSVDVCWDSEAGDELDVAPFAIAFDFDDESFSQRRHADGISIGVNVGDHPRLEALYDRVRFDLRPEWRLYYESRTKTEIGFHQVLHEALKPLLEDVPFLAAFCLLLISNGALRQQPCDRTGINKPRMRKGRPPLLDHVELTMSLGEAEHERHRTDTHRPAPRLHFVRGHLVHRDDRIFWRTSHMRGKPEIGSISSRTVSLRLSGR